MDYENSRPKQEWSKLMSRESRIYWYNKIGIKIARDFLEKNLLFF